MTKNERGLQTWIRPPISDDVIAYAERERIPTTTAVENLLRAALDALSEPVGAGRAV